MKTYISIILVFLLFGIGCLKKYCGTIINNSNYKIKVYADGYFADSLESNEQKRIVFFAVAQIKSENLFRIYEIKTGNHKIAKLKYSKKDFDKIGWQIIIPKDLDICTSRIIFCNGRNCETSTDST